MNYMKDLEGVSFDQIITEMKQDGEYFTAYVCVAIGSYQAGKDKFMSSATSRNQFKALGYALEDVAKQIQKHRRLAP
jgi:hypothetical protein